LYNNNQEYPTVGLVKYIDPPSLFMIGLQSLMMVGFAIFSYPADEGIDHSKS